VARRVFIAILVVVLTLVCMVSVASAYTVKVWTDKDSYTAGERVYIYVEVLDASGNPIHAEFVGRVTILGGFGDIMYFDDTDFTYNGVYYSFYFTLQPTYPNGTCRIEVTEQQELEVGVHHFKLFAQQPPPPPPPPPTQTDTGDPDPQDVEAQLGNLPTQKTVQLSNSAGEVDGKHHANDAITLRILQMEKRLHRLLLIIMGLA